MSDVLIIALFALLPVVVTVLWIISLVDFVRAKVKLEKQPDLLPASAVKEKKLKLIFASVAFGTVFAVIGGFMLILLMSIAYM